MDPVSPPPARPAGAAGRRSVVARLRKRYGQARQLVSSSESHGNLEWILGTRRNRTRDDDELDSRTAELVVLWLEDLSLELDLAGVRSDAQSGAAETRAAACRQSMAENLRLETREFAAAFLGGDPVPVL